MCQLTKESVLADKQNNNKNKSQSLTLDGLNRHTQLWVSFQVISKLLFFSN